MKKYIAIIGLLAGLALVIVSFTVKIPDSTISMYGGRSGGGYKEYVGGDAYNIQIEAAIRSGEIAGTTSAKAIYLAGGAIIIIHSLLALGSAIDGGRHDKKAHIPAAAPAYGNGGAAAAPPVEADTDNQNSISTGENQK
jgi:hypothetical protein